ncbi:MAG: WYL domain-containing protein [Proteobacteria bacterium]|nr:WYL domain-containing protein [Pseudomonadota bacterium]
MTTATKIKEISFAQRQRLLYIESMAYWEGTVGRNDVAKVFGISGNHITKDFTLYRKSFPQNLDYDVSIRAYKPAKKFKPQISNGSPEEYLSLLKTHTEIKSYDVISSITGTVSAFGIPPIKCNLEPPILRNVTRAISQKSSLVITYQTMKNAEASKKIIWPQSLIYSGYRWHARSFDEDEKAYKDFVLHRFGSSKVRHVTDVIDLPEDKRFNTFKKIQISPKNTLSESQKNAIAKEYGMLKSKGNWVWDVEIRECLIPYFLYWIRLDKPENHIYLSLNDQDIVKTYKFQ